MSSTEEQLLCADERVLQYREAVIAAVMAARMLLGHDFAALLGAIEEAHAAGPILNPTLYRAHAANMEEDRKVLQAASEFVRTVMAVSAGARAPTLFAEMEAQRERLTALRERQRARESQDAKE